MYKNEELQKWLNDDRYVQTSQLSKLWGISIGQASDFVRKDGIKPIYIYDNTSGGCRTFYDKTKCEMARAKLIQKIQDAKRLSLDTAFIKIKDLSQLWGVSIAGAFGILSKASIKPTIKINIGSIYGNYAFYDRAECERARPFINQPEQKEVEKVENIGELATATKHQILIEACADDFVWDKVTMKNKIMPVKNYCDERGNFVSLFKKDETVSAILAYKDEIKKTLEKCIADENLVTTKTLEKLWGIDRESVYQKIYKLKIKPCRKFRLASGKIWNFYKKSDCIESKLLINSNNTHVHSEYEMLVKNDKYITVSELANIFKKSYGVVDAHLRKVGTKKIKCINPLSNSYRNFYEKDSAVAALSEYFSDAGENKYNPDIHVTAKDLEKYISKSFGGLRSRIYKSKIKAIFTLSSGKNKINVYDLQQAINVVSDVLKPRYRCLIENKQKEVEKVEEKQMELPEPKEQTPDIIPADTIDLFTMSELESELKNRGVELTADVRNKINASDMPEMQHIATMLRGNTKTIAIRLSVLSEIAGQLREVKPVKKTDLAKVERFLRAQHENPKWHRLQRFINRIVKKHKFVLLHEIEDACSRFAHKIAMDTVAAKKILHHAVRYGCGFFWSEKQRRAIVIDSFSIKSKLSLQSFFDMEKSKNPLKYNAREMCYNEVTNVVNRYNEVDAGYEQININGDLKNKIRFMAMADNVDLAAKLESIITAAWIMGNYDKR